LVVLRRGIGISPDSWMYWQALLGVSGHTLVIATVSASRAI
jgi:hypothetical protein